MNDRPTAATASESAAPDSAGPGSAAPGSAGPGSAAPGSAAPGHGRFRLIGWVTGGVMVGLAAASLLLAWIVPGVGFLLTGVLHGPGDRDVGPPAQAAVDVGYAADRPQPDRPDGAPPIPAADLDPAALAALIRLPASAPMTADTCEPADLVLSLAGLDRAAGHRYALLVATNVSDRTCVLEGWPGLGVRGHWGTVYQRAAVHSNAAPRRVDDLLGDTPDGPLPLAPDSSVRAELEWTGALAGTHQESAALLAVQVAAGGPVARYLFQPDHHVDLGPESTVLIGKWRFWQGSSGPLAARL